VSVFCAMPRLVHPPSTAPGAPARRCVCAHRSLYVGNCWPGTAIARARVNRSVSFFTTL
jgi:hypothetical protein